LFLIKQVDSAVLNPLFSPRTLLINPPTHQPTTSMSCVKTYAVDVNTLRTPEEGAHSPSWPNGLILIIIINIIISIII
jgi:hypothetical protein